uniref:FTH domain-containing protein n=1 Tax=Panagrellus redivivus TaxID=6233 RepID=A0A7E4VZL0_PANRE
MWTESTGTTIKRFTYDWLIRFAELHPFTSIPGRRLKLINYKPHFSQYAVISPLFTKLLIKYMPHLVYSRYLVIKNGEIQKNTLSLREKHVIFICQYLNLKCLTSETVAFLKKNAIFFYAEWYKIEPTNLLEKINFLESVITPDDLKYLLKYRHCFDNFQIEARLTEPMMFDELFPFIAHCGLICLNVENLIYGKMMADVLRESQSCPKKLWFHRLDVSQEAVLDLLDAILSLPTRPDAVHLCFTIPQPVSFAKNIVDKYKSFDDKENLTLPSYPPSPMFREMHSIREDSIIYIHFHNP